MSLRGAAGAIPPPRAFLGSFQDIHIRRRNDLPKPDNYYVAMRRDVVVSGSTMSLCGAACAIPPPRAFLGSFQDIHIRRRNDLPKPDN
jgi:hypothetical protein